MLWENPGIWAQNSLREILQTFDFHQPQITPAEVTDPVSLTGTSVILNLTGWKIYSTLADAETWLILPLYLLTFAAAALAPWKTLTAPGLPSALIPLTFAAFAAGALLCIIAPCIFATYDSRYSIPVIPLFILSSAFVIETLLPRAQASAK